MPRHLSEAQRARAIAKLEENWSLTEVAAELNVSKSCIFYIKKRWQGEQRLQKTIRQGIGKVSTENEDNALVEFINHNPFETAVKAREETLFPGSLRTTQRRLKQCGFKNCVAAHKMFLTEEHKQRRVQFANEFLQGNEFWNNVMFSDEMTFKSSKNERLHNTLSKRAEFGYSRVFGVADHESEIDSDESRVPEPWSPGPSPRFSLEFDWNLNENGHLGVFGVADHEYVCKIEPNKPIQFMFSIQDHVKHSQKYKKTCSLHFIHYQALIEHLLIEQRFVIFRQFEPSQKTKIFVLGNQGDLLTP
ncbi:hypothetical protein NQ318_008180 [Aromia moschata]|uniref:Transposase Tc1-like domain-containing protein n=1 Tax=Aromia moschata TaxID=1265417 RepID=A0AAV8YK37_9CUCU|nr:hypothetical protein NQ318_008180 [Aromia moschata]